MTHLDHGGAGSDLLARLARLEARNDELERQGAELGAQVVALHDALHERRPQAPPVPGPAGPLAAPAAGSAETSGDAVLVDRRQLLRRGAAAAAVAGVAAAGAVGLDAAPAAAANGQALTLGSASNTASAATTVSFTGSKLPVGFGSVDGVYSGDLLHPALFASATGAAFDLGVQVEATGTSRGMTVSSKDGNGVEAFSQGRSGLTVGTGVGSLYPAIYVAAASTGISVEAVGSQLLLQPGPANPTVTAALSKVGEIRVDVDGTAWCCTVAGMPGTWRKLAGAGTAGSFHVLPSPVRVYDSRSGSSPAQGPKAPLAAGATRALTLAITGGTAPVPPGATAAAVNVLLVNAAAGNGNFTLWAKGAAKPQANTLVWGGSAGRFSTFALTAVDATAKVQVSANLQTDLVLDVVGYYR